MAKGSEGFTLAEVAIALSIVALVLGLMIPTFLTIRTAQAGQSTEKQLQAVMQAVAAYVQANGCVPCPMPPLSAYAAGHGVVRGDTSASPAPCGTCSQPVGFVPFRSLGLSENMARDGYNNWLTYAVDASLTAASLATGEPPAAPCHAGDEAVCTGANDITNGTRKKGICKTGLGTASRLNVSYFGGSQQAAVLVMSHGANMNGAYVPRPLSSNIRRPLPASIPSCAGLTGAERCNTDDNISFAVAQSGSDDPYDDRMLYLDRNALVSYLGGPGCQTVW